MDNKKELLLKKPLGEREIEIGIEEGIDIIMKGIDINIEIEINIKMMIIIQVEIGREKLDLKKLIDVIIVENLDIGLMNVICLKKISK